MLERWNSFKRSARTPRSTALMHQTLGMSVSCKHPMNNPLHSKSIRIPWLHFSLTPENELLLLRVQRGEFPSWSLQSKWIYKQLLQRTSPTQMDLASLLNTLFQGLPCQINYIKNQTIKAHPKLSIHYDKSRPLQQGKFKSCTTATRVNHLRIYQSSNTRNISQNSENSTAWKQCFGKIFHLYPVTRQENMGALAWCHGCSWWHNLSLSSAPSRWIPSRGTAAHKSTSGEGFNKTQNIPSPSTTIRQTSLAVKIVICNYTKQCISIWKCFRTKAVGSSKYCWKSHTLPFQIYQQLEWFWRVDRVSQKQDLEDSTFF